MAAAAVAATWPSTLLAYISACTTRTRPVCVCVSGVWRVRVKPKQRGAGWQQARSTQHDARTHARARAHTLTHTHRDAGRGCRIQTRRNKNERERERARAREKGASWKTCDTRTNAYMRTHARTHEQTGPSKVALQTNRPTEREREGGERGGAPAGERRPQGGAGGRREIAQFRTPSSGRKPPPDTKRPLTAECAYMCVDVRYVVRGCWHQRAVERERVLVRLLSVARCSLLGQIQSCRMEPLESWSVRESGTEGESEGVREGEGAEGDGEGEREGGRER